MKDRTHRIHPLTTEMDSSYSVPSESHGAVDSEACCQVAGSHPVSCWAYEAD